MRADTQIKFDLFAEPVESIISKNVLINNPMESFGDFLMESKISDPTFNFSESVEEQREVLDKVGGILDYDLILPKSLAAKSGEKVQTKEKIKSDTNCVILQEQSEKLSSEFKVSGDHREKVANKVNIAQSVVVSKAHGEQLTEKGVSEKQFSTIASANRIKQQNNQGNVSELKVISSKVLSNSENSSKVGNKVSTVSQSIANKIKSAQSVVVNKAHGEQLTEKGVSEKQFSTIASSNRINQQNNQGNVSELKVNSSKVSSNSENSSKVGNKISTISQSIANKVNIAQSVVVNRAHGEQLTEKGVSEKQFSTIASGNRINQQNNKIHVSELKVNSSNVSSNSENSAKVGNKVSTVNQSVANKVKSAQSVVVNRAHGEQLTEKGVSEKQFSTIASGNRIKQQNNQDHVSELKVNSSKVSSNSENSSKVGSKVSTVSQSVANKIKSAQSFVVNKAHGEQLTEKGVSEKQFSTTASGNRIKQQNNQGNVSELKVNSSKVLSNSKNSSKVENKVSTISQSIANKIKSAQSFVVNKAHGEQLTEKGVSEKQFSTITSGRFKQVNNQDNLGELKVSSSKVLSNSENSSKVGNKVSTISQSVANKVKSAQSVVVNKAHGEQLTEKGVSEKQFSTIDSGNRIKQQNNQDHVSELKVNSSKVLSNSENSSKVGNKVSTVSQSIANKVNIAQSVVVNRAHGEQLTEKGVSEKQFSTIASGNRIKQQNNQGNVSELKVNSSKVLSNSENSSKVGNKVSTVSQSIANKVNIAQSVVVNKIHGKQLTEKGVTEKQFSTIASGNRIKQQNNQDHVSELKVNSSKVLSNSENSSKVGNKVSTVNQSIANKINSTQSVVVNRAHGEQFSGKDLKNVQVLGIELRKGERLDNKNIADKLRAGTQKVLKSKLGSDSKFIYRTSIKEHHLANGIINARPDVPKKVQREKSIEKNENEKLVSTVASKISKYTKLNLSNTLKNTGGLDLNIRNIRRHLINKASQNKSGSVNKVQSTDDNSYNYRYFKEDIGSSEKNQKFFIQEKIFSRMSDISTIGKHKNIFKQTQLPNFTEIHQTQLTNSVPNQLNFGSEVSLEIMIQKIARIISQSQANQTSRTNLVIDGGKFGPLEIKFEQDSIINQMTIIVESKIIHTELEKLLPTISEDLSKKGFPLDSLEAQVGDFNESKTQNKKQRQHSEKSLEPNMRGILEDKINQTIAIRNYGYNTIEVIA